MITVVTKTILENLKNKSKYIDANRISKEGIDYTLKDFLLTLFFLHCPKRI